VTPSEPPEQTPPEPPDESQAILDMLGRGTPSVRAAAGEGPDSGYPREGCSARVRKNVVCEECGQYHNFSRER
jgi:hypothetical protein